MNCDRIAKLYRWLEYGAFGRALMRRRERFLPEVFGSKKALVLGDGDGRFVAKLVRSNPEVAVECIDLSGRMLALAERRAGSKRVHFRHENALLAPLRGHFDLVSTHFFLDCLSDSETESLVHRVARQCAPGARWVISEFRDSRPWQKAYVAGLYSFFGLTTGLKTRRLPNYRRVLRSQGFTLVEEEQAAFGLLVSELWVMQTQPL